jgi:hypothetical protein
MGLAPADALEDIRAQNTGRIDSRSQALPVDLINPASAPRQPATQAAAQGAHCQHSGTAMYRMLTGCDPATAAVEDDSSFDRHVFASILAVAAVERATVTEGVGLAARDLAELIAHWFPDARVAITIPSSHNEPAEDEEAGMVRGLLLAHRSTEGATGRWLAAMIARRAMEPNHLWEDLGLRDRSIDSAPRTAFLTNCRSQHE